MGSNPTLSAIFTLGQAWTSLAKAAVLALVGLGDRSMSLSWPSAAKGGAGGHMSAGGAKILGV